MGFTLTPEEKVELEQKNSLVLPLPGANATVSGTFHNPVTGQELLNQPIDPYHLPRRLRRGWRMGPAPAELKAKWEAGAEERLTLGFISMTTIRPL